jgi:hypothetical protein
VRAGCARARAARAAGRGARLRRVAVRVEAEHVRELERLLARVVEEDLEGDFELAPALLGDLEGGGLDRCGGGGARARLGARRRGAAARGGGGSGGGGGRRRRRAHARGGAGRAAGARAGRGGAGRAAGALRVGGWSVGCSMKTTRLTYVPMSSSRSAERR